MPTSENVSKTKTNPKYVPINLEIKLYKDEQVRIQQELNNLDTQYPTFSGNVNKEKSTQINEENRIKRLYISQALAINLRKVKTSIQELRHIQLQSNLAPKQYKSTNYRLIRKHNYLNKLDIQTLNEFPPPVIKTGWGDGQGLPYSTPNIHIVKTIQQIQIRSPSPNPWDKSCDWGTPTWEHWDISYRQPNSSFPWWKNDELWKGVKSTLLKFAYTKTFGQWDPILNIIESCLYKKPKRQFELHYQNIADSTLKHYYPYTNDYFNNHRIAKRLRNDPDPEFPNQPTKRVKTYYYRR